MIMELWDNFQKSFISFTFTKSVIASFHGVKSLINKFTALSEH